MEERKPKFRRPGSGDEQQFHSRADRDAQAARIQTNLIRREAELAAARKPTHPLFDESWRTDGDEGNWFGG